MKLGQVVTFTAVDGRQLQGTVWAQGPTSVRGSWWLTRAPAGYLLVRFVRGALVETELHSHSGSKTPK